MKNRRIPKAPAWLMLALMALVHVGCATTGLGPPTDRELALGVKTRLENDAITGRYDFGVTAMNGVVYLRGSAPPSGAIRARAISLALGAPGVIEVVDDLFPPTSGIY